MQTHVTHDTLKKFTLITTHSGTHTRTHQRTHMHAHTNTHTHTHTHTQMHTHTYAHTRTHTHRSTGAAGSSWPHLCCTTRPRDPRLCLPLRCVRVGVCAVRVRVCTKVCVYVCVCTCVCVCMRACTYGGVLACMLMGWSACLCLEGYGYF